MVPNFINLGELEQVPRRFMKSFFFSQAITLLAVLFCFSQAEEAYVYSGNPKHPSFLKFETSDSHSSYRSILLLYLAEYATALANESPICYGFDAEDLKGISPQKAKSIILEYVMKHPEEVNDVAIGCESSSTPLSLATRICDFDIVLALLNQGAIPYSPNGVDLSSGIFRYGECSIHTTEENRKRVQDIIQQAQSKWPKVDTPYFFNILRSDFYRNH